MRGSHRYFFTFSLSLFSGHFHSKWAAERVENDRLSVRANPYTFARALSARIANPGIELPCGIHRIEKSVGSGEFLARMRASFNIFRLTTLALVLAIPLIGCDRQVSTEKTTDVSSDGSVKSSEKTVTKSADGTVTKTEESKKTTPPEKP